MEGASARQVFEETSLWMHRQGTKLRPEADRRRLLQLVPFWLQICGLSFPICRVKTDRHLRLLVLFSNEMFTECLVLGR